MVKCVFFQLDMKLLADTQNDAIITLKIIVDIIYSVHNQIFLSTSQMLDIERVDESGSK